MLHGLNAAHRDFQIFQGNAQLMGNGYGSHHIDHIMAADQAHLKLFRLTVRGSYPKLRAKLGQFDVRSLVAF